MDNQWSPVLSWAYILQGKNIEELRHSLVCTTVELEETRIAVEEELRKRDNQIMHLKDLLSQAIRERDEANEKCEKLLFEKLFLHQPQAAPLSSIESQNGFSSSDCEESIVSSPVLEDPEIVPLPEKGKLLQAVMKAGPLLHTLLLAGPLPQWRHPPPQLESFQIPPVTIPLPPPPPPPQSIHQDSSIINCGIVNKKRGLCQESDSPTTTKYQRFVLL